MAQNIISVSRQVVFFIEIDEKEYIRLSKDSWLIRMGESWEYAYNEENLEKAFQAWEPPNALKVKDGSFMPLFYVSDEVIYKGQEAVVASGLRRDAPIKLLVLTSCYPITLSPASRDINLGRGYGEPIGVFSNDPDLIHKTKA